jgi:hypothetical protein
VLADVWSTNERRYIVGVPWANAPEEASTGLVAFEQDSVKSRELEKGHAYGRVMIWMLR